MPSMPDFPNEVWSLIFESIERPSHILNVVLTSKFFYALAIRSLYRNLYWQITAPDPSSIPAFLTGHSTFSKLLPLALTIEEHHTLSTGTRDSTPFSSVPNHWVVYRTIVDSISTFSNLQTLTVDHTCLPNPLLYAIPHLPRLRHLCLRNVFFSCSPEIMMRSARRNYHPNHSFFFRAELPELELKGSTSITELTLWCCMRDSHRLNANSFIKTLQCFIGPRLRILRIDWCNTTARYLADQMEDVQVTMPTELEVLELKLPRVKAWSEGSSLWTLLEPLKVFLAKCPKLQRFAVVGHLPLLSLETARLPCLRSYSGPLLAALPLLTASNGHVREVEITNADETVENMTPFLFDFAQVVPSITKLDIRILEWDMEIVYAVVQLFPLLEHLGVKYKQGYPDENSIVALGPQLLSRLLNLRTVHIYNTLEPLPSSKRRQDFWSNVNYNYDFSYGIAHLKKKSSGCSLDYNRKLGPCAGCDEEVVDLLIPWRRYCSKLTEVRFVRDWVWRRAGDGDQWCKRRLTRTLKDKLEKERSTSDGSDGMDVDE